MHAPDPAVLRTLLLALLAMPPAGLGQADPNTQDDRPDASQNPLLTDRSADQSLLLRSSRGSGSAVILPISPPGTAQVVPNEQVGADTIPLADGSTVWVSGETLRPEGTFLSAWTGEVVRLRTGGLAFLPNTAAGSPATPALPLMPCVVYGRLASLLGAENRGLWVSITGEVFLYNDRNFLLPSVFAGLPSTQATPAPAEGEAPGPTGEIPAGDTRINDLIRGLEAEQTERRGIDITFAQDADAGATGQGPRVEGRMLLSRRGRMVRSGDGGWMVAVDNDAAGGESADLPNRLYLLPCRMVSQMENQAEHWGESWEFEVSGDLHRHGERVYLLPRLFVALPEDDVRPLQ